VSSTTYGLCLGIISTSAKVQPNPNGLEMEAIIRHRIY
jgi:hypothetical protein